MKTTLRKCSIYLAIAIFLLSVILCFQPISLAAPVPSPGDYIVCEFGNDVLSMITPGGVRTVIHSFTALSFPAGVAIDSAGNYIVTEINSDKLSKITPSGVRTVIYNFPSGTGPVGVAVDSAGNYIVCEDWSDKLVKITPSGVRTVIYNFPSGTGPAFVAVDSAGNYIVTESQIPEKLVKITPSGVRTVIYNFPSYPYTWTEPTGVAVDSAGNYIVCEYIYDMLSKITPGGVRTTIYPFTYITQPVGVAIDSAGNYIVTENARDKLSKITPSGVRTVIYNFPSGTHPWGVAIVPAVAGYSVTIWGWDYIHGWQVPVPITMDGVSTGYSTPHTFTGLTGTHTFTVPSTNSEGHPFSDWDVGGGKIRTDETITVNSAGVYTARYRAGYSVTIWGWDYIHGWQVPVPITMDGVSTGYSTPHTFTGLTGTHTFTVPSTNSEGHPFSDWSTGSTSRTLTVSSAGVYTARYRACPWDITGPTMWVPDGKCDMRDVALVAKLFGSIEGDGKYDVRADITGPTYLVADGKIDMRDVALVAKHYGEVY